MNVNFINYEFQYSGNIPSQWRDRGYKGLVSVLVCFAESMDHVSNRLFEWLVDLIKKNLKSHSTVATVKNILFEVGSMICNHQLMICNHQLTYCHLLCHHNL